MTHIPSSELVLYAQSWSAFLVFAATTFMVASITAVFGYLADSDRSANVVWLRRAVIGAAAISVVLFVISVNYAIRCHTMPSSITRSDAP